MGIQKKVLAQETLCLVYGTYRVKRGSEDVYNKALGCTRLSDQRNNKANVIQLWDENPRGQKQNKSPITGC